MPVWGAVMQTVISTNVQTLTHLSSGLNLSLGLGTRWLHAVKDNCHAEKRQETLFFSSLYGGGKHALNYLSRVNSEDFVKFICLFII